jgi:hypothetical protein
MVRKFKCENPDCGIDFERDDTLNKIFCTACNKEVKKNNVNNKPNHWGGKSKYYWNGRWHED